MNKKADQSLLLMYYEQGGRLLLPRQSSEAQNFSNCTDSKTLHRSASSGDIVLLVSYFSRIGVFVGPNLAAAGGCAKQLSP